METDTESEARQRTGAINGRYQIVHPDSGLIEVADTLGEAFQIADRFETRTMHDGNLFCGEPFRVEVYDRMARCGQPRVWRRRPKNGGSPKVSYPYAYCVEGGDKFSLDAFWKCVQKRGLSPKTDDLESRLWS